VGPVDSVSADVPILLGSVVLASEVESLGIAGTRRAFVRGVTGHARGHGVVTNSAQLGAT